MTLNAALIETIQQHQQVDRVEARRILKKQHQASRIYPAIKAYLGQSYAGAWFDPKHRVLMVASTETELFPWIRAAGGEPVLVDYSLEELSTLSDFVRHEIEAVNELSGLTGLMRDIRSNQIVLMVGDETRMTSLQALTSELFAEFPIEWVTMAGNVEFFGVLDGGSPIVNQDLIIGSGLQSCSVGFGVQASGNGYFGRCSVGDGFSVGVTLRSGEARLKETVRVRC